ncbi:MAG TPA: hypothetical protein VE689_04255, partial [Candidatus Udaeobacter sp.]|nr:hypothetical protein [Candidatus Udaeobacter sp.]
GAVDEVVAHIQAAASVGPVRVVDYKKLNSQFSCHAILPRMVSILEQVTEQTKPVPAHASAQETEAR